jgi:hypothetical protein
MERSPGLSPFPMREQRKSLFQSKSYGLDVDSGLENGLKNLGCQWISVAFSEP